MVGVTQSEGGAGGREGGTYFSDGSLAGISVVQDSVLCIVCCHVLGKVASQYSLTRAWLASFPGSPPSACL